MKSENCDWIESLVKGAVIITVNNEVAVVLDIDNKGIRSDIIGKMMGKGFILYNS